MSDFEKDEMKLTEASAEGQPTEDIEIQEENTLTEDADPADEESETSGADDSEAAEGADVIAEEEESSEEVSGGAAAAEDTSAEEVLEEELPLEKISIEEFSGEEPEKIPEEDELEFISLDSVRDKSHAATGEIIRDEHVSEKKTKRRSVDAGAAKKEKVQKIAKKNLALIVVGILVVIILISVLVIGVRSRMAKKADENKEQPVSVQEYETDAYEQINTVITNYYNCYASGDVSSIIQYAYPMSETEQTYITMYSAFVESYENIVCYTKTGLDDSSYIVSVSFSVKYNDVETTAAGMDFFYVRITDDETAYIDNTYSPFNLLYQEYTLDQEILQLIQTYESSEDVIALQAGVQTQYEQALEQDEALRTLVEGDLAAAISSWQSEYEEILAQKAAEAAAQVQESTDTDESAGDAESTETTEDTASTSTETESKAWVYVTDTVYIREEPSESSTALASATAGSEVRQLAVTDTGWTKVKSGDVVGYIKTEYISSGSTGTSETSSPSSSGGALAEGSTITLTSSVNIRSSMSESSERIGLAYSGEQVTVVMSYSEGWTKVTWNGKTGYVRTDVLAGM
ncbi:MAG: SH3 domain-containing protein [Clostridiales bacterium]|nr:SH3 domain-containing protein [Clostridiales bacterium]